MKDLSQTRKKIRNLQDERFKIEVGLLRPFPMVPYALVESVSINQLPSRLFEDTDTLQELGFTIAEIKDGFSVKNKEGKNIPVNINAFYDELERLPERETKRFFFLTGIIGVDKRNLTNHLNHDIIENMV